MANAIPWGWIAGIVGGGVVVAGAAYAATGGGSQPAAVASKPAGSGTVTNPTGTTTPGQTAGIGPAANVAIVTASQNGLAILAATGKVPGLTYTVGPTGGNGNATDPAFVAALQIFQKWENAKGGYTPPGGTATQLNTNGVLDFATVAAVLSEASS
jgi:hypothetical protein